MRIPLLLLLLACFAFTVAEAQNPLPIGRWRSHLPYQSGKDVAQSKDKIFFATEMSLLSLDKDDLSVEFISTVNGLSNTGVEFIRYHPTIEALIVVYKNTAIDLVYEDGEVVTLNQVLNFQGLTGEKRINDLHIANDSIVYLAAAYGVSRINLRAREFQSTTFTGIPVDNVYTYEGQVYMATEEGVYRIAIDAVNPDDFRQWDLLGPEEGFPEVYTARAFTVFEGALHLGVNDTIFRYENDELTYVHYEVGSTVRFLSSEGELLLMGFRPSRIHYLHPDGRRGNLPFNCVFSPNYALEDERGRLWYGNAATRTAFRYQEALSTGVCQELNYDSPFSEAVWDLTVANNQLWMASGGLGQTLGPIFIPDGFASFIDGQWTIYNRDVREELKGQDLNSPDDDIQVFVASAVHPGNGKVYMGSFIEGLVELDPVTDEIVQYSTQNSTLQIANQDIRVRVGGLAFDDDNGLWVSNHAAPNPLSVLLPGGEWRSFNPSCNQNQLLDIAVDNSNNKWIRVSSAGAGLILFNEGDVDDPSDDECRTFTSGNSELPSNDVNCLAADLNGDIWAGTNQGIVIFECGSSAFSDNCTGTRRIVEQDGFGAFLLETESVTSIAVDGANRKWVGTQNGVFLLSPTGERQIARFTVENSPLFDNRIISIAVNNDNGEVFIGTASGLLSYQSDAVAGQRTHRAELEIYPNPVRENYEGPIAIKGLARDAVVKITDLTGKLVFETNALGGQAIWDGRDYNGRRVQTGVYLIFSSSNARFAGFNAKPDAAVGKIVVIN